MLSRLLRVSSGISDNGAWHYTIQTCLEEVWKCEESVAGKLKQLYSVIKTSLCRCDGAKRSRVAYSLCVEYIY